MTKMLRRLASAILTKTVATILFATSSAAVPIFAERNYYIVGEDIGWDTTEYQFTYDKGLNIYKITIPEITSSGFQVKCISPGEWGGVNDDSRWYGPASDYPIPSSGSYSVVYQTQRRFLVGENIDGKFTAYNVTLAFTPTDDAATLSNFRAYYSASADEQPHNSYEYHGQSCDWSEWKSIDFQTVPDGTEQTNTVTVHVANGNQFGLRLKDGTTNGVWYACAPGYDPDIVDGAEIPLTSKTGANFKWSGDTGQLTITFTNSLLDPMPRNLRFSFTADPKIMYAHGDLTGDDPALTDSGTQMGNDGNLFTMRLSGLSGTKRFNFYKNGYLLPLNSSSGSVSPQGVPYRLSATFDPDSDPLFEYNFNPGCVYTLTVDESAQNVSILEEQVNSSFCLIPPTYESPSDRQFTSDGNGHWSITLPESDGDFQIMGTRYDTEASKDVYTKFGPLGSVIRTVTSGETVSGITQPQSYHYYFRLSTEKVRNLTVSFDSDGGYPRNIRAEYEEVLPALNVKPHQYPAVYLVSEILNSNRVTPEYEMIPDGNGIYRLDGFAMRNTRCLTTGYNSQLTDNPLSVILYENEGAEGKRISFDEGQNVYVDPDAQTRWQPGWNYNASFDPNTNRIEIIPANGNADASILPYIAIAGENLTQLHKYGTPNGQTTSAGWQEAYIQYGANGKPLLDNDGNAMYNTCWPPRHSIYFNAVAYGQDIELISDNLTFHADDNSYRTGEEWTSMLKEANPEAYHNIDASGGLVADRKYRRLTVANLWMLGAFKFWTGWSGRQARQGAQWDNHMNWGADHTLQENEELQLYSIEVETPYNAFERGHNWDFKDPHYFKTMEFFIPEDNFRENSVLYTTIGFGNPQIRAKATPDFQGSYMTELDEGRLVDYTIADFRIVRCDATHNMGSADKSDWRTVNRRGEAVSEEEATLCSAASTGITTPAEFNEYFRNKWISGQSLTDGKYFYYLDITFSNGGRRNNEVVQSNPFTIMRVGGNSNVSATQLVGIAGSTDTYITYETEPESTPRIVTIGADGSINIAESEDTTPDLGDASKYVWTTKILMSTEAPEEYVDLEAAKNVNSFAFFRNGEEISRTPSSELSAYCIADADLAKSEYTAQMNFTYTPDLGTATTVETIGTPIEFQPTLPGVAPGITAISTITRSELNGERTAAATIGEQTYTTTTGQDYRLAVDFDIEAPNLAGEVKATVTLKVSGAETSFEIGNSPRTVTVDGVDPTQPAILSATTEYASGNPVYDRWGTPQFNISTDLDEAPVVRRPMDCQWWAENRDGRGWHLSLIKGLSATPGTHMISSPERGYELEPDCHWIIGLSGHDSKDEKIAAMTGGLHTDSALPEIAVYPEQKDLGMDWDDTMTEKFRGNDYELSMAQVYLFDITNPTIKIPEEEKASRVRRANEDAEPDTTHSALVSKPGKYTISFADDMMTHIDNAGATLQITAGKGFVEIASSVDVAVYSTNGIKMCSGNGHHKLPEGIYIVRTGDESRKVIVR